ncbi:Uncharacterised protein [Vibrio cholerae]|nr:Uncharacterised protein [Vibrio cholerae]
MRLADPITLTHFVIQGTRPTQYQIDECVQSMWDSDCQC